MTAWQHLGGELDRWRDVGIDLDFWVRDDDAVEPTPQLDCLLSLCNKFNIPVLLAVIPGLAQVSLARRLLNEPLVRLCQHGWRHINHAPMGEKSAEFGQHRPLAAMLADVEAGQARFAALFPGHKNTIFVPPWNRIAPDVAASLPEIGIQTLSAFRPIMSCDDSRLQIINPDVDIINWKAGRSLRAAADIESEIVQHLVSMRTERPHNARLGLLLHHLVHRPDSWALLDDLLAILARHPTVTFADPGRFHFETPPNLLDL